MQQTEKYWNLIHRVVVVAILFMALVGLVLAFTPKVRQMNEYQQTKADIQNNIDKTEASANDLRDNQRFFKSDRDFVERIAHERGYAHTNEVIFHFSEGLSGTNELR